MKNKQNKVIGLQYDREAGLPKVILKGQGRLAEALLDKAKNVAPQIPVVSDEYLLNQLYRLPMDADITADLFELVAILLAHIYKLESKAEEDLL